MELKDGGQQNGRAAEIVKTALGRHELSTLGIEGQPHNDGGIESRRRHVSTRARRIVTQARDRYFLEKLAV